MKNKVTKKVVKKTTKKKLDKTSGKLDPQQRDENGRLKKGIPSLNPKGRPLNSRNFYTDFKEAIKKLKLVDPDSGKPLDEFRIIAKGLQVMMRGDERFVKLYSDTMDRVYGKPTQVITGADGKDLIPDKQSKEYSDEILGRFIKSMIK